MSAAAPRRAQLVPLTPGERDAIAHDPAVPRPTQEQQRQQARDREHDQQRRLLEVAASDARPLLAAVDERSSADDKVDAMARHAEEVAYRHWTTSRRDDGVRTGYGELDTASLDAIFAAVRLTAADHFFDVGSGFGKPCFQAALRTPGVRCAGVEYVSQRVDDAN
jgi:hypothetical protein